VEYDDSLERKNLCGSGMNEMAYAIEEWTESPVGFTKESA
jgi:hypothetical protein